MTKKRSQIAMHLALMTAFSAASGGMHLASSQVSTEDVHAKYEDNLIKKGAKKFYYGDKYVIARDQKNADRKAKALGIYDDSIKKEG